MLDIKKRLAPPLTVPEPVAARRGQYPVAHACEGGLRVGLYHKCFHGGRTNLYRRRLFVPGRGGWCWQLLYRYRHDAKEAERCNARQARRKDAEGAEA